MWRGSDPAPYRTTVHDNGDLLALRYNNRKIHFAVQEYHGFDVWCKPLVRLRMPMIVNLRADPFERTRD